MGHITIVLFDGVEELDAVGPWEVLSAWAHQYPGDGWSVSTLSADGSAVTGAKGLTLAPHHSAADSPAADVLIYPGGIGTRALLADAEHLDWVRAVSARSEITASVCTGALVLAAAGLLANRPATTHWASLDLLAEIDPSIRVDREARWVDDGDVITAAGVSAGIDMALALLARLAGSERAREVKRYIQYDPAPPV